VKVKLIMPEKKVLLESMMLLVPKMMLVLL
jgi:hypothetical protein